MEAKWLEATDCEELFLRWDEETKQIWITNRKGEKFIPVLGIRDGCLMRGSVNAEMAKMVGIKIGGKDSYGRIKLWEEEEE
jgi:hypothetical protein